MLELLEIEMIESLALLGLTGPAGLNASYVHPAAPLGEPHVLSAFPLLRLSR